MENFADVRVREQRTAAERPEAARPVADDRLADPSMSVEWSHWSRCESSFSMLLVPHRPGALALAEEVVAPQSGKRMLALFHVAEARDLSLGVSSLFATGSPHREALEQRSCYLRYAMISVPEDRHAVCEALQAWMEAQAQTASGMARSMQSSHEDCDPADCSQPQRGIAAAAPQQQKAEQRPAKPLFPAGF